MSLSKGTGRSSSAGSRRSSSCSSTKLTPVKKKKAAVLVISSSSEDSNSENDSVSVEDSGQGGMDYSGKDSSCSDGEPPKKQRRKSITLKKETDTRQTRGKVWDKEYYVEKIVDMSYCPILKKNFFFVKWLNYDSKENTWEPEEHLTNSRDIVDEFLKKLKKATKKSNNAKKLAATKMRAASSKKAVQARNRMVLKNKNRNRIESSHSHAEEDSGVQMTMEACAKQVVDIPSSTVTSSPVDTKESIKDWLEDTINREKSRIVNTQPGNIFYFKIIANNDQVGWLVIDTYQPLPEKEEYYRCVVTEDLTGKQPKLVYGATTSVDGEKFCLVQFEGHSFVDVIPPDNLFARFPSLRKFFELHCPHLFKRVA